MFTVYILYSNTKDKIYIGYTSDPIQRFYSHNIFAKKGYTIKFRPWEVVYTDVTESKAAAMKRESQLKSSKGREWILNKIRTEYKMYGFISVS